VKSLFKYIFCSVVASILAMPVVFSQISDDYDSIDNMIIYSHERFGQVIAHNLGFGMGYRFGKNITAFNTRFFSTEMVTMRSPKQIKLLNPVPDNAKRYVYGKLNDVFILRGGFGYRRLLNSKPYWGGVEVSWNNEVGGSLALEKPYYLFVVTTESNIKTKIFDANTSWEYIYGRAPFTKGLNEIKVVPGAFIRSSFSFEFGDIKTHLKAFEAGAMLEFFPSGVTIMFDSADQPMFLTFYIAYSFGRRLNKY
jgi:hypothetical protein